LAFAWGRLVRAIIVVLLPALAVLAVGVGTLRSHPHLFVALAERLPRALVEPIPSDAQHDEEFFKYGAIGNEANEGFPYKVWAVLPQVCSSLIDKSGYASFGFTFENGNELPIGMSRTRLGWPPLEVEQVAINCAVCHVQTYKLSEDAPARIFVGGAANRLDALRYLRFLTDCAASPGFDTDTVIAAIRQRFSLTWIEGELYRHLIVPITREAILDRIGRRYAWTWSRPAWGPGRVEPFNPVKFGFLELPIDQTIGTSDVLPPWNAAAKEAIRSPTLWHWDGLSDDLKEVVLNSALGDGTTKFGYRQETIDRLLRYLRQLQSPKAPLPIDQTLYSEGASLFEAACARCHAPNGELVLKIIPLAEIGTDAHRWRMWTQEAAATYNEYDKEGKDPAFQWSFNGFKKRAGYLAEPLAGIWLTGPYLHNGSVPTLDDLLKPADQRPAAFVRGLELIDLVKGGNAAPSCKPQDYAGPGFCYDTMLKGNGNGGHNYGTTLNEAERRALVHYLLTL
jgi:hypothetical protein